MFTKAKKDDNHNEIKSFFEKLGWSTLDIHQLKRCADIICAKNDITIICEIKDGAKLPSQRLLTTGEKEFRDRWRGHWFKVESVQDVLDINKIFFGRS